MKIDGTKLCGLGLMALAASTAMAMPATAQVFQKPFVELGVGIAQIGEVKFGAQTPDSGREPAGKLSGGFENAFGQLGLQVDYFTDSISVGLFEDVNVETITVSATYTQAVSDWFKLYGGVGVGAAMFDYYGGGIGSQFPGLQSEDTQPVGQVFAGARAQLFGSPLSLFLEGQYQVSADYDITPAATGEYHALSATTGLRWNF